MFVWDLSFESHYENLDVHDERNIGVDDDSHSKHSIKQRWRGSDAFCD